MESFLDSVDEGENDVDDLDSDERNDETAESVNEQVAAENVHRRRGAELHAAQRERDQEDDDDRVEDHGAENRAVRRVQLHDV